jgi:hypothetical protein
MASAVRLIRGLSLVMCLAMLAAPTQADPLFQVARGKGSSVCSLVLDRLEACVAADRGPSYQAVAWCRPAALVGDWKWQKGSYHWVSSTMDEVVPALFSTYDIDNDGEEEIVLYQSWTLRSQDNTALFLFRRGSIDFSMNPRLTVEELNRQPRIASGPPWPYGNHGLYALDIAPLVHNRIAHLVLMDGQFARKGYWDRRLVVAKYKGIEASGTDQLDVVCSIRPKPQRNETAKPNPKGTPN